MRISGARSRRGRAHGAGRGEVGIRGPSGAVRPVWGATRGNVGRCADTPGNAAASVKENRLR